MRADGEGVTPPARPQRWLFFDAAEQFGGHEVMLLRWIEELLKDPDVSPRLVARDGSRLFEQSPEAIRASPFPAAGARPAARWRTLLADMGALRRAMREERPDVLVCATGALGQHVALVLFARCLGGRVHVYAPMLGTFASMGYRMGWVKDLFVRWLYSRVPVGWIAITEQQADDFRRWARPRGAVHVLPNTVDRELETAPPLPVRVIAPGDRLRVLVLGRLDAPQKGLDLLLEGLETAPRDVQDSLLVTVTGEGPYGETLRARRATHPVLARCLDLQPWRSARSAMSGQDVLLLPSRFEGVPLVMLEAMALGLPVIASDLPGIRAHLPPECLFAVGDMPHAWRLLAGLRAIEARDRLANRGRREYEASASSAAFAHEVAHAVRQMGSGVRLL